jgi:hypothetical protein
VLGPVAAVSVLLSRGGGKVMAQRLLVIAGLASAFAFGFPPPSTGHDWYKGLTNSAGVACCGSAECRPAAARYNERTGFWETEVIEDTWLPVPPGALAPTPSPDGNYHVCEHAGTIRCFFQPGQVKRDPLDGAKQPNVAHGLSRFLHAFHRPAARRSVRLTRFDARIITAAASKSGHRPHAVCSRCRSRVARRRTDLSRRRFLLNGVYIGHRLGPPRAGARSCNRARVRPVCQPLRPYVHVLSAARHTEVRFRNR